MPGDDAASAQHCSHVPTCRLYPVFRVQSALRVWQMSYCEGDHSRCERFKRSSLGEDVPDNLLPNGKLLGAK
jgi:hypothetical protein